MGQPISVRQACGQRERGRAVPQARPASRETISAWDAWLPDGESSDGRSDPVVDQQLPFLLCAGFGRSG